MLLSRTQSGSELRGRPVAALLGFQSAAIPVQRHHLFSMLYATVQGMGVVPADGAGRHTKHFSEHLLGRDLSGSPRTMERRAPYLLDRHSAEALIK